MHYYAIAIDGPAGAGKSTMAKAVAQKLGCIYLDTGAIYRTVAYHMALMGISPKDADGVKRLIDDVNIEIRFSPEGVQRMILNGRDVTEELRTPEISQGASQVSVYPVVRQVLLDLQRDVARSHNVVMDGRDIGTVVLPDADVKIFLTASCEVRAKRRLAELQQKGSRQTYRQVLEEIQQRDERDANRAVAPLRCAPDAVRVDTTDLTVAQSLEKILELVGKKLPV